MDMSRVFTPFPSSRLMNFLSFRRFDLIRWGLVVVLLATLVVEPSRSLLNAQSLDSGGLAHDNQGGEFALTLASALH